MTGGTLLQDAMGMIDLSYIAEVADALPVRTPKRKPLLRYATLAACFCLLIGSLTIMTIYRNSKSTEALPSVERLPSVSLDQMIWEKENSLSTSGIISESTSDSMVSARWSGWNMSGDLYLALTDAAPDTHFAVLVTRRYNYTAKMNFVYQGKTRGQWEAEREILKTQQRKLEELSKEGEWLKYGSDLYTKGTPDGEKWTRKQYEERVNYYGAYFLEQYIVNGSLLSHKIKEDMRTNDTRLMEISALLVDLDVAYVAQCAQEDLLKFAKKGIHYALKKGHLYLFVTAEELAELHVQEKSKLFLSLAKRRVFEPDEQLPSAQIDENIIGFAYEKITFYTDGVRYSTVSSDMEVIEAMKYLLEQLEYTSDFVYISIYANPRLSEEEIADMGYQAVYFSTYSNLILLNVPLHALNLTAIRDLSLHPQVQEIHISPPILTVLT